ncbi:MAG: response regulator transcription factor, partial [Oscillospiraceae bacterium]
MSRIFIIEDDVTLREQLAELLINAGYQTEMLTDFENSVDLIKNINSDLVLMDINLPNVNGEQILKEMRKISDTPVIMLTSRT